ncbi:MAG: DNA polymerase III subunit delta [Burkholderiaceae bacterium]
MQIKAEALAAQFAKGLKPVYTVHGDEPLLAQEAGDALRAEARRQGYSERQVFTVSGAYFDWAPVIAAAQAMSLFSDKQMIEIRIPSGKPGKDGSDALQRYCAHLQPDVLTLVTLPRLDRTQLSSAWFTALDGAGLSVKVDPVERRELPAWIARRLQQQGQSVAAGPEGQQALEFFADRVEGNLLAAHQELQKLALLHPAGELSLAQIEGAVLDVARFDVFKLSEALLGGRVARVLRMLEGLRAEGEAAVLVHWTMAEDIRALKRVHDAVGAGKPLPMALREARVWGPKERLFERIVPQLRGAALARLVVAAQICDGIVKGLRHPEWPADPWDALARLALMLEQALRPPVTKTRYG